MRNLRKTEMICPECRKVFVKKRDDQRFDSKECRIKFFNRFKKRVKKAQTELQQDEYIFKRDDGEVIIKKKIPILPKITCRSCGKDFIPMFANEWFCCHMCRHVDKRLVKVA
jgi:hypothetical protein